MTPRRLPHLLAAALVAASAACSDGGGTTTTTTAPAEPSPSTTAMAAQDPELEALLLTAGDLPPGFSPGEDVDDTITSFCVGQDAAAGLQARARAVAGFGRDGGGASVVQLAFRFRGDGAATFVAQAEAALTACDGVPTGASGLAFSYEPVAPEVQAALGPLAGAAAARYGVSAGSERLSIEVAVVRAGDVGVLVAVLGLDLARDELDGLAAAVFGAAAERLAGGQAGAA